MAALASDWLRHFQLLWTRWTELNKTWQEARSQRPLPSLFFSGRSKKNNMAALASDWLRHFRLLLWNRWTELNKTWQEARYQRPLPSLCFSGWSEETILLPWPRIGWDIFDFSSATDEQNSTKHERKQDLNILYQVCVFQAYRKNKMAAPDWLGHFQLFLSNRWMQFNKTWAESKISTSSTKFLFLGRLIYKKWPPWQIHQKVAHCTQVHVMWPFGPLVKHMVLAKGIIDFSVETTHKTYIVL